MRRAVSAIPCDDAIYVERRMDATVEAISERTRNSDQHQRWDPRFTEIEYPPREDGEPQTFTYRTHVGAPVLERRPEGLHRARTEYRRLFPVIDRTGPRSPTRSDNVP